MQTHKAMKKTNITSVRLGKIRLTPKGKYDKMYQQNAKRRFLDKRNESHRLHCSGSMWLTLSKEEKKTGLTRIDFVVYNTFSHFPNYISLEMTRCGLFAISFMKDKIFKVSQTYLNIALKIGALDEAQLQFGDTIYVSRFFVQLWQQ